MFQSSLNKLIKQKQRNGYFIVKCSISQGNRKEKAFGRLIIFGNNAKQHSEENAHK